MYYIVSLKEGGVKVRSRRGTRGSGPSPVDPRLLPPVRPQLLETSGRLLAQGRATGPTRCEQPSSCPAEDGCSLVSKVAPAGDGSRGRRVAWVKGSVRLTRSVATQWVGLASGPRVRASRLGRAGATRSRDPPRPTVTEWRPPRRPRRRRCAPRALSGRRPWR